MLNVELKDAAGGHPEPEELAAFIDGGLTEAEAARLRAHLGRCEDCYDVFVEAVRFQREFGVAEEDKEGEETSVRPFPPRRSGVLPPWTAVALAASLVALLGLVVYRGLSRPPGSESTSELTASLAGHASALVPEMWPRGTRGETETAAPAGIRSFRLGVETVNLRLVLQADNREKRRMVATRIADLLAGAASPELTSFYRGLAENRQGLSQNAALTAVSEQERMFPEHIRGFERLQFSFGRWAEAGRLAALDPPPGFFRFSRTSKVRRFPDRLHRELGEQLQRDGVQDDLRRIERISGRKTLTAQDREELAAAFEKILRTYYSTS